MASNAFAISIPTVFSKTPSPSTSSTVNFISNSSDTFRLSKSDGGTDFSPWVPSSSTFSPTLLGPADHVLSSERNLFYFSILPDRLLLLYLSVTSLDRTCALFVVVLLPKSIKLLLWLNPNALTGWVIPYYFSVSYALNISNKLVSIIVTKFDYSPKS